MGEVRRRMRIGIAAWCLIAMVFGQAVFLAGSVPGATAAPTFYLPWEAGSVWQITYGNGDGEHDDDVNQFAFDAVPDLTRSTRNVTAIAKGKVIGFQNDVPVDKLFYSPHAGNCLLIQHEDMSVSIYAHLATGSIPKELRHEGADVRGGMVIGTVGNTGYADGEHLHWSLLSEGHMYTGEGYRTCAGTSISSHYADNDRELIEDGGVPRQYRFYESFNVDPAAVQAPSTDVISDPPSITAVGYDRNVAADVAFGALHEEYRFDNDSANLVSKALWGGGLPRTDEWAQGAAANPDALVNYLTTPHRIDDATSYQPGTMARIDWSDNTAQGAMLGDVIAYDWEGDGIVDHVAIVTNINDDGFPEVSEHSPTHENRYWSYSITADDWIEYAYPGSVAYVIHIAPITLPNF
jgi:hypothetical protein